MEFDAACCSTLWANRPLWDVFHCDIAKFDGRRYLDKVDLLAAGLPCLPFTVAGKQEGELDERNMFPDALRLIGEMRPKAIMIENVGVLGASLRNISRAIAEPARPARLRGRLAPVQCC
ncbi:hypothetical protein X758_33100 [Mesorhizobium sp. LSHC416B00]|nr:hypothetical protein X758_33100 [Mesorhizobium sp. LSHC416B00]